ncbi:hypothetical protein E2C01_025614 [Portunus trituberculatus]|uniref:Uncharacterized protein n=1 Tax=Portunus trituberculatus TaxID=210409 RepID=A0A5B7EIE3_PORTR|nr:hypothetical protein [Portunus trituberculatus]
MQNFSLNGNLGVSIVRIPLYDRVSSVPCIINACLSWEIHDATSACLRLRSGWHQVAAVKERKIVVYSFALIPCDHGRCSLPNTRCVLRRVLPTPVTQCPRRPPPLYHRSPIQSRDPQ